MSYEILRYKKEEIKKKMLLVNDVENKNVKIC